MGAKAVEVTLLDRQLTPEEILSISNSIYNHILNVGVKGHPLAPLAPIISFGNIHRTIEIANRSGYLDVYAIGERIVGILMYDFGNLWWANGACLKELLVYAVDPNFVGFGRIALERLEELAVEHDCVLIETGSALALDRKLVENLYMKKGKYDLNYPTFVKVTERVN